MGAGCRYGSFAPLAVAVALSVHCVSGAERGIDGTATTAKPSAIHTRTALIIGNGAYPDGRLRNPAADAELMARTLASCGFEVLMKTDCDYESLDRLIVDFGERIRRPAEAALFYYAGHGLQVKGQNYLVPIDARLSSEAEIKFRCVNVGLVLAQMEDGKAKVNIVVLDACRNNPFSRAWRTSTVGLAPMDAVKGTILSYSTSPGCVASDGAGANGLYTSYLAKHVLMPGIPVERVLKLTRAAVARETSDRQIPWENSSLIGDFCFVGAPSAPRPLTQGRLLPAPPPMAMTGHLQVNVNVPQAQVAIDDRLVGNAAVGKPLNVEDLPVGRAQVLVSAEGFDSSSQFVEIVQGKWSQIAVSLKQQASPPASQLPSTSPDAPRPVSRSSDGRFLKYSSGVIRDSETNLEWYVCPKTRVNWSTAKRCVEDLAVAGGGWRLPTVSEVKSLYQKGRGRRNRDPIFSTDTYCVWSGEAEGQRQVLYYSFTANRTFWSRPSSTFTGHQAFAVRSTRK